MKYTFCLLVMVIFLHGCGEFQALDTSNEKQSQGICVEEEGHNTYVVDKNSVYATKRVSSLQNPNYKDLPLEPVHLSFLDSSGYLKNDTFHVLSYTGQQVKTTNCPLKFGYEEDQGVALSQLMSYHYSSMARRFSLEQSLFVLGQGIYIITQAPLTGWSSEDNTIYLGVHAETLHDSALDASILLNLISEANIYYATQGAIYKETHHNHRDCMGEEQACCLGQEGCSKAITIGLSQYFSSYFFKEAPTVGETYSNRLTGIEDCGISRDLNVSRSVSMTTAFSACGQTGYVYPMATVYASIWWNVLQNLSNTQPESLERFQVFYLKHLKGLRGDFDFLDVFNSMKEIDNQEFGSAFTSYFRSEFTQRGIDLRGH